MTDLPLTGGCQCGAVRYALHAEPKYPHICHCRMCQKAFGSFFAPLAGGVLKEEFEVTRGTIATFKSSDEAERGFCANCGTPLTFRYLTSKWIAARLARPSGAGGADDPIWHRKPRALFPRPRCASRRGNRGRQIGNRPRRAQQGDKPSTPAITTPIAGRRRQGSRSPMDWMNWSIAGLCYDIVGAGALAFALFFNTPAKIAHQAATYWDSSQYAAKAFVQQTVDARFGALILIAGFVLQIVGQLGQSSTLFPLLILILLLVLVIAFLLLRSAFVERLLNSVATISRGRDE